MTQKTFIQIESKKVESWFRTLQHCRNNLFLKDWLDHIDDSMTAIKEALAQPAQEPIGYAVPTFDFDNSVIKKVHYSGTVPLYTTPPQRPWVGLTDELQAALWEASRAGLPRFHTYATLIEKELRILNT